MYRAFTALEKLIFRCVRSKFKSGEGELEMFCLDADKLHEKLSACPRFPNVPRIVTQPLPPTPEQTPPPTPPRTRMNTSPSRTLSTPPMLVSSRRMSRSENDLQKFFFQRSLNSIRQNSSQELILLSNENVATMKKVSGFGEEQLKMVHKIPN